VENLYYNLPVRKQDLIKRSQYHLSSALTLIQGYSFFNRDTRIALSHIKDSKEDLLMAAETTKSLLDKCIKVLGVEAIRYMIEIKYEEEEYNITGVVSNPQVAIKKSYNYISINSRLVNIPPPIKGAITSAYKEHNQSKYMYVIEFRIKPEWMDSNLSPDKMDIILQQESRLAENLRVRNI
jgi:DNA mismatch repair protein PMS2